MKTPAPIAHVRAALVEQLGDDQFTKREAADRALRAGAAPALNYLRQLDFDRLDAEQQFRVTRIIRKLTGHSEDDSADAVAASLLRNSEVWLALLSRPEKATRETAARQLTALLGKPIDVDPAAEPKTQEAETRATPRTDREEVADSRYDAPRRNVRTDAPRPSARYVAARYVLPQGTQSVRSLRSHAERGNEK